MSAPYEDDGLEKGLLLPGEADAAAKKTADDAFRSRMVGRECDVWRRGCSRCDPSARNGVGTASHVCCHAVRGCNSTLLVAPPLQLAISFGLMLLVGLGNRMFSILTYNANAMSPVRAQAW